MHLIVVPIPLARKAMPPLSASPSGPLDATLSNAGIDALLAAVLRGEETRLPGPLRDEGGQARLRQRMRFHGIGALLLERWALMPDWPGAVLDTLRTDAREQAMWELGHKASIAPAIAALARQGVPAIVLKGTAMAHDLYPRPALRTRGDTDLLVTRADVGRARAVLAACDLSLDAPADDGVDRMQEAWLIAGRDGTTHCLELHWQALDAAALEGLLPFETCLADARPLPRLCPGALRLGHPAMLLHALVHRAKHMVSTYFVDNVAHHDGDRLIWLMDFDLLARALDETGWARFADLALASGLAPVCREGLEATRHWLGTPLPGGIMARLEMAGASAYSDYLFQGGAGRTLRNLAATQGLAARLRYLRAKLLPGAAEVRRKYPAMQGSPIALLYLWRLVELVTRRSGPPRR